MRSEAGSRARRACGRRWGAFVLLIALTALALAATAARAAQWNDYRVIIWQEQTPASYQALAEIGVDAAAVLWSRVGTEKLPQRMAELRTAGLGWYFENIATDFYAPYHRWTRNKPENWRFRATKRRYRADPNDPTVFYREPSLSDPAWLARIRARLTQAARAAAPYPPLFYNLGDESGIADNGSYWDFDMSPISLAAMRVWLRSQYGTLAALNREWGTKFARWDAVMPETTNQAFARTDQNFAAWADFKASMDVAFARAFRVGTEALHKVDPAARSALEGAQIPGWGGYDYTRLAGAVDVMEIYDYAQNIEIVRSLAPKTVILATTSGVGPAAAHKAWDLLLRGERGLILWEPGHKLMQPDGGPGPNTTDAKALFDRLHDGIAALLIGSVAHYDPVAMLYSPPSFRTQWMLDVKPTGVAWAERTPDSEYEDNAIRTARRGYFEALRRLGIAPRFISPTQLSDGILERRKDKVLILPHTIALSGKETAAVRRFAASGGTVIADVVPGAFDAHSKARAAPSLATLFATGKTNVRLMAPDAPGLGALLASAGIVPAVTLRGPDGKRPPDVESYAFRNGRVTIVAAQRMRPKGVQPPGETVRIDFPAGSYVTDLMNERLLGRRDRVTVTLDTVKPAIFAVSPTPIPEATVSVGPDATLRIARAARVARFRPFHVTVTDGKPVPILSRNVLLSGVTTTRAVAPGRPAGRWRVEVGDLLAGTVSTFELETSAANKRTQ